MVLIALAIVFAGLGAMSLSSSDSSGAQAESDTATATTTVKPVTSATVAQPITPPPATTTPPETTTPPTTTTPPATTGNVDKSVAVRVYNNSNVGGLAAKTASQLTANGYNVTESGNYSTGVIPKTTVYYGSSPKEQALAVAIANELGCNAEPRFPGIADSPAGVIVILAGE
ncbi:LytR C-terminal domain-containing protein [Nocardia sp. 2]|uniref:LytR C-terminal domain-containing protein n=2 Tax=Nocardia acididurans TaxID=2802282 RepID=A0ABS1LWY8_9NOCA|nr:LytR C-terminal domain-containing protein [Nocardia acididurans]MBL1072798.1 LytR C-terminal domain-containing protein [Nocardia acididurans]